MTPDQISTKHLYEWQIYLSEKINHDGLPCRPGSINNEIASVKLFLGYMASLGFVGGHLPEALVNVKMPKDLPGGVLTHDKVKRFLDTIPTDNTISYRNRTMIETLYTTGVRASELLSVNIDDIDFSRGVMKVMGKGRKERIVPIGRTALKLLDCYMTAVRPDLLIDKREQAVFLNRQGKRLNYASLKRVVREYREKSGLNDKKNRVTPHTFRRSCTTELIKGGANVYHVKELLGHERLDTLKHYVKLDIKDLKKTHEKCHPRG